jgi:hypothetical protein
MTKKKARIGSSFDDFLKQEGLYEEVTARDQTGDRVAARRAHARPGLVQVKPRETHENQPCPARSVAGPRQRVRDPRHPHPRRACGRTAVADGAGVRSRRWSAIKAEMRRLCYCDTKVIRKFGDVPDDLSGL